MNDDDHSTLLDAKESRKTNEVFLRKMKSASFEDAIKELRSIHYEVFQSTDCLSCANCCKTTPALITHQDIKRISKYLQMPSSEFKKLYVITDLDGEMMMQRLPCTFLDQDNKCTIYDVRPESCRRYPHTDEKEYFQRISLNLNNTTICPAAARILEKLKKAIPLSS